MPEKFLNNSISPPPPKIALIVPYFGSLPPYFPVWLESAKANRDIDFLFYTDQDVQTDAANLHVTKTTLEAMRKRISEKLGRSIVLPNAYKLCDYRPVYGLLFEEELQNYDFWGYCDIDLVFGQIRHFVTDTLLAAYDRIYAYGHLSIYRNNEQMRRAFELPGSWFTPDEAFSPFHIGMDELCGINRICLTNRLSWYTGIDFADLSAIYKHHPLAIHQQPNYPVQAFYYLDGCAYQRYVDGQSVKDRELVYIHWQKKRPIPERVPKLGEAVIFTPDKLIVRSSESLTPENMLLWNPPNPSKFWLLLDVLQQKAGRYWLFLSGSPAYKKVYWKRKRFVTQETVLKKQPYL